MPKQVLWPDAPPRRQEGGDATTSQEELAWMPKWGVGSYSPAAVAGRLSQAYTTAAESHLRIEAVDNVFKAKQWLGSLIGWESLSPTVTRLNKLSEEAESLHFFGSCILSQDLSPTLTRTDTLPEAAKSSWRGSR